MAKRRSKKQKASANHQFLTSWDSSSLTAKFDTPVKGQRAEDKLGINKNTPSPKSTNTKAQSDELGKTRHEIKRSIFLASLVLGLELVIYLVW